MQQVRRWPRGRPETHAAERAVEADQRHEHDASRAKRAEPRKIVLPVGIDDKRVRQVFGRLMVVQDDDVEPERFRARQNLVRGRAAIDGDEQARARCAKFLDGLGVRAVALENAVGNAHEVRDAAGVEEAREQRGRTGPVDVVVAEDGDGLLLCDGADEAFDGGVHVPQGRGVGHEFAEGGIEIGGGLVDADPPARQHAGQNVGETMALDDGERALLAGNVQTRPPWAA